MDIVEILKKLQQFEKFKELMLSKEQREVFNYTPQPKLYTDHQENENLNKDEEELLSMLKVEGSDYRSLPRLMELYLAYRKLQDEKDPNLRRINAQIIQSLGRRMVSTLKRLDAELVVDQKLIDKINQMNGVSEISININNQEKEEGEESKWEILQTKGSQLKLGEPLLQSERSDDGRRSGTFKDKIIEMKNMLSESQLSKNV